MCTVTVKTSCFQVLHGEQYTQILSDLPTSGDVCLTSKFVVTDVVDKGANMAVVVDVYTAEAETGRQLIRSQMTILVMGESSGR